MGGASASYNLSCRYCQYREWNYAVNEFDKQQALSEAIHYQAVKLTDRLFEYFNMGTGLKTRGDWHKWQLHYSRYVKQLMDEYNV